MWNLDDPRQFIRVVDLHLPWAETWGDKYRERRERIRERASPLSRPSIADVRWWAVRISVQKSGRRSFDVENVPKQIIDAFCAGQIKEDQSSFVQLGLYPDDAIDHVRILQVFAERGDPDKTHVEIFGFVGGASAA